MATFSNNISSHLPQERPPNFLYRAREKKQKRLKMETKQGIFLDAIASFTPWFQNVSSAVIRCHHQPVHIISCHQLTGAPVRSPTEAGTSCRHHLTKCKWLFKANNWLTNLIEGYLVNGNTFFRNRLPFKFILQVRARASSRSSLLYCTISIPRPSVKLGGASP